jgi:hypothetical protein
MERRNKLQATTQGEVIVEVINTLRCIDRASYHNWKCFIFVPTYAPNLTVLLINLPLYVFRRSNRHLQGVTELKAQIIHPLHIWM